MREKNIKIKEKDLTENGQKTRWETMDIWGKVSAVAFMAFFICMSYTSIVAFDGSAGERVYDTVMSVPNFVFLLALNIVFGVCGLKSIAAKNQIED